jgi:chromosome segregation ATPase
MSTNSLAERWRGAARCVVALALFAVCPAAMAADAQTRQAQKRVEDARQALRATEKPLAEARKEVREAGAELARARSGIDDLKRRLTAKYKAQLNLPMLVATRDAAIQELSQRRDKVLGVLKTNPDFQAAAAKAGDASKRLAGLAEEKSLSDTEQDLVRSQLSAAIRKPFELQAAELAADSRHAEAAHTLQSAEQRLAGAQAEIARAVDNDKAMLKARETLREAPAKLAKAQKKEAAAQSGVRAAQSALDRAVEAHRRAVAEDRRDDKSDKKKR